MNGIYVSICILFVFPLIVYMGASGELKGKTSSKVCKFLGDISYPIYIVHYPLIYTYTAWVGNNQAFLKEMTVSSITTLIGISLLTLVLSIAIAYGCLKLYDEPIRKWLTNRFMVKRSE